MIRIQNKKGTDKRFGFFQKKNFFKK